MGINTLSIISNRVELSAPNYFFMPILSSSQSVNDDYVTNSFATNELFINNSAGVVTSNDKVL
ncbi:MAG: hypothetical protein Q4A05_02100, partial [Ruminococcus sp.]|nr:hypothetical protein [Ruminococcus sp.]